MSIKYFIASRMSICSYKELSDKFSFLNLIMTEARASSVRQKLVSFYPIVDRCLEKGRRVNLVVFVAEKDLQGARVIYTECFLDYLQNEKINLIFVTPVQGLIEKLALLNNVIINLFKLREPFAARLNIACLAALARARIKMFYSVYDALPCDNWLGLTGGIELPALKNRVKWSGKRTLISALQFGQASMEQKHFAGYSVNNLFVYDIHSEEVFNRLNLHVDNLVIAGSSEFEYYASRLHNIKLADEDRLNIVFVDQPVMQRSEYSFSFLKSFLKIINAINADPRINITIKPHPRGSAFDAGQLTGLPVAHNWSDCLSRAHIVIGFFSNLCDFALYSGRITFYVGSESILDYQKKQWITERGGYITNDLEYLLLKIMRFKNSYAEIAAQIINSEKQESQLPSSVIYNKMVACSEAI